MSIELVIKLKRLIKNCLDFFNNSFFLQTKILNEINLKLDAQKKKLMS